MANTKKVRLEQILQGLDPIPRPAAASEQYATPASIAAEVLYFAHGQGDLTGRSMVDLGSGNGILAIGAKLLGASRAVGVESDPSAIDVARRNAERAGVDVDWRLARVDGYREAAETVIMNPPFGAQFRHADRPFLDAAMAIGRVVYTFLNPKAEEFVRRRIDAAGGRVRERLVYAFPIPYQFPFHREETRTVEVVLYRVEVAKG